MTGSWRQREAGEAFGKHDHIILSFAQQPDLIYRDPRRFGLLEYSKPEELEEHRCFQHLGPEPLDDGFNPTYLKAQLAKRSGLIKAAIMDQKVVVGVGNIYAAESLFRAGIHPMAKGFKGQLGAFKQAACSDRYGAGRGDHRRWINHP